MTTTATPPLASRPADRGVSIATAAVHAGEPEPRMGGAITMPVFQSANYLHEGTDDYHGTRYVRLSNTPNHEALAAKLRALGQAEAAMVAASGMAAISAALLTVLEHGDHVLAVEGPYGGTRTFLATELPRFGIACTFVDGNDPDAWAAARRPETKALYLETITNPLMKVPDLPAAVDFCRRHGLVSMIDNTFASPVNFRPCVAGFDLSLHSGTKYLNGHSDIAAGAVLGRADLVDRIHRLLGHVGGHMDPHACFLFNRGLKTLVLRVGQQTRSAETLAAFLAGHDAVSRVHYPGLPSCPGHAVARQLFDGFGGMLAFELAGDAGGGHAAADRFIETLTIPLHAASLGGLETLVIRPAVTAYADVPADDRRAIGVTDGLIRLSVGIEDTGDLVADFERALAAI